MKWNLGIVLPALCLGCATQLTLDPDAAPRSVAAAALPKPLVIELVELKKGGFTQAIDDSLTNRVAMDFRQTRAFPSVFETVDAHHAPRDAVRVAITLELSEDPHSIANGIKGGLTVLSLFLLTPVLRFDLDAEVKAEALLRTCDGWSKRVSRHASGSLRSALFSAEERSERALHAGVLEHALVPLVAEVGNDAELRARVGELERSPERPQACSPRPVR